MRRYEKPIEVQLDWRYVMSAALVAAIRQVTSLQRGSNPNNGGEPEDPDDTELSWFKNAMGSCAETAASLGLGRHGRQLWNDGKTPDLSGDIQVRWASNPNWGMPIRKGDDPDQRYLMVSGTLGRIKTPVFLLHGWIYGRDAMRDDWWRSGMTDRKPAWWVETCFLNPASDLVVLERTDPAALVAPDHVRLEVV